MSFILQFQFQLSFKSQDIVSFAVSFIFQNIISLLIISYLNKSFILGKGNLFVIAFLYYFYEIYILHTNSQTVS